MPLSSCWDVSSASLSQTSKVNLQRGALDLALTFTRDAPKCRYESDLVIAEQLRSGVLSGKRSDKSGGLTNLSEARGHPSWIPW